MRRLAVLTVALAVLAGCANGDDPLSATTAAPSTTTTAAGAGQAGSVTGTFVQTDADGVERRWQFAFAADGSFRVHRITAGAEQGETHVYDATTRRAESRGEGYASVEESRALGPPDYNAEDNIFWVHRELGWHVSALAHAKDRSVTSTTMLDRPAHRHRATFEPNAVAGDGAPDAIEAVIDADTSFPLLVVEMARGKVVTRLEVTELTVGGSFDRSSLVLNLKEKPERGPWRLLATDEPVPLEPASVPAGFTLSARATAASPGPTGPEASNPVAGPAFALSYRRGMQQLVVTTRAVGDDLDAWADPFGGEGMSLDSSRQRLKGGIVDGANAEIVIDPQTPPHLWVIAGDHVITVAGPLTKAELVEIAQSMN